MRKTSLKHLITTDELIPLFTIARVPFPIMVEMFGLAGGFRGFWIDIEHVDMTGQQVQALALAARANEMDCFVRMAPAGYWEVTRVLEAGAGGVMAAQIHSAEHAKEFVSWTKFAPEGVRGLNMGGRDCAYTHKPAAQFVEDANREHFVAIQIETLGALDEADGIAALEGVDILFVGPADLSLALGVVGQFHHEKLWSAIDRVADACRRHGKTWGCVAPDADFADKVIERGCRLPTFSTDITVLRRGLESIRSTFAKQFG